MSTELLTSTSPFGYQLLHSFDLLGTIVFASMGALMAYEQRRNGLTALLYAGLTALGGGTLRDVLVGQHPVFWVRSPIYLLLALTAGLLTFLLAHYTTLRREYFCVADAFSLAVFTIVGIQTTLITLDTPTTTSFLGPLSCVLPPLMGLTTSVAGGLMRDIIAARPPCVLQQPAYIIASLLSGSVYLASTSVHLPEVIAILGAFCAAILLLAVPKALWPQYGHSRGI